MRTPRTRRLAADRHDQLLAVAVELAEREGLAHVTISQVAERAKVSRSLTHHYFKTAADLVEEVVKFAVVNERLAIIADGLFIRHPIAWQAAAAVRLRASRFAIKRLRSTPNKQPD